MSLLKMLLVFDVTLHCSEDIRCIWDVLEVYHILKVVP